MKIVKVKITRWGISKLQCIKAVKNLMSITLEGAKDMIENSKMPCVLKVYDNEKLETFISRTKEFCPSMEYTVEDCNEDSDCDTDVANNKTMSRTDLVDRYMHAINNAHAAFNMLISQNDEIGDRYNKVCGEANLLQAEIEKLKANNNNDLCIQLREEIACLKRDNGVLKESNNTFVETIKDQEKQIRDLEKDKVELNNKIEDLLKENNTLREGKKVVETNNDSLMIANKSLREDVQRLNEILQAIRNIAF